VGFRIREVNGHIESHYSKTTSKWTEPVFVEDPYLRIHGMAPGLNYGQQCYEGLKAFRGPGDTTINIFRPDRNAERLQHSASFISIPEVPTAHFERCVRAAVALNAEFVPPHATGAALYIRPLLFGSSAQLGLNPPAEYTFCVFVVPTGVYHGTHPVDAVILEAFDRTAPHGTGSAKVGGNYAPVLRWSEAAHADGFGITLHLDSKTRTEIDEFSTSGFIGVLRRGDDTALVVPDSRNIVKSITSDSVCELARSFGWSVEKRRVAYEELPDFTEVMAAGTAAALVPIRSITMKSKGDKFEYEAAKEHPGPVATRLLAQLKGIQQGTVKDAFGWLDTVQAPENYIDVKWDAKNGENGTNGSVDRLP